MTINLSVSIMVKTKVRVIIPMVTIMTFRYSLILKKPYYHNYLLLLICTNIQYYYTYVYITTNQINMQLNALSTARQGSQPLLGIVYGKREMLHFSLDYILIKI